LPVRGQVAALVAEETIAIKEYEVPVPGPGAVVLEVTRANVCGSDVHIYHYQSPLLRNSVLGHEFVGRIHALGAGVTTDFGGEPVAVGDRVVAVYFLACRRCPGCQRGEFSQCRNSLRLWSRRPDEPPHFYGAFATHYYVDPEQYFYRVPDQLTDATVAGANCGLAQALFALGRIGLRSDETIVIQGAGGLGLYGVAVARDRGARVIVVDAVDERLELARAFGAHEVIDMKRHRSLGERIAEMQRLTGSDGADVVLEVTGVAAAHAESVELAGIGGRVASVGNINVGSGNEVSVSPGLVTRKNLTIRGFLRYDPWVLHTALEFLKRTHGQYPFEALTDRDYSLSEIADAIEQGASRRVARAAVVPNAISAK
jgi:threonine dehydrogenase-like Zn-dependent dehydrogenase